MKNARVISCRLEFILVTFAPASSVVWRWATPTDLTRMAAKPASRCQPKIVEYVCCGSTLSTLFLHFVDDAEIVRAALSGGAVEITPLVGDQVGVGILAIALAAGEGMKHR